MFAIDSGSIVAASTLTAARLISPLRSRPVGTTGGAGKALGSIGSSGRASKTACKALDGFVYRPRRCTKSSVLEPPPKETAVGAARLGQMAERIPMSPATSPAWRTASMAHRLTRSSPSSPASSTSMPASYSSWQVGTLAGPPSRVRYSASWSGCAWRCAGFERLDAALTALAKQLKPSTSTVCKVVSPPITASPLDRQRDRDSKPDRAQWLWTAAFELTHSDDRRGHRENTKDELPDHAYTIASAPAADNCLRSGGRCGVLLDLFDRNRELTEADAQLGSNATNRPPLRRSLR
jgi:hypothetical protein